MLRLHLAHQSHALPSMNTLCCRRLAVLAGLVFFTVAGRAQFHPLHSAEWPAVPVFGGEPTIRAVTGTDASGCVSAATVLVTVNPLPVVSITPAGSTTFCLGGSVDLTAGEALWVEDRGERVAPARITAGRRINVDYAGVWAKKPWRFRLKDL